MKSLFVLFLLVPLPALAEKCGWNADHTFWDCGGSYYESSVGVSGPGMGDLVEGNPAAIPTAPAPFGLEGTFSNRAAPHEKPKAAASTIKGFEGIGFGIGSWAEGTFSAPDLPQHFLGSEKLAEFQDYRLNPPNSLGLRFGTSLLLPKRLFPKGVHLSVGGSGGLGRVKGDWSPQAGVLLRVYGIGFGFSESFERVSASLPRIRVQAFGVGMPIGPLYLGYTYITLYSQVNRTFANAMALRWSDSKLTIYGNLKLQKDHRGAPDAWTRAGIQRRFGKRLGLGYDYGLYRYAHSLILQLYL